MAYYLDSSGSSPRNPDQMKNYIRFSLEETNGAIMNGPFYVFFQDGEYHIQPGLSGLNKRISPTVYEPFVSLLLGGFGYYHEPKHRLQPSTDEVDAFLKLAQDIGYMQLPRYYADDTCFNVTPLNIKQMTNCQIFKYMKSATTFLSVGDKIYPLGQSFAGYGLTDLDLCDFDHDGQLDLVYTYSAGSGIHRSGISVFNLKTRQETVLDYSHMSGDLYLGKIADDHFAIYAADASIQNANFADLILTRNDRLAQIVSQNGSINHIY